MFLFFLHVIVLRIMTKKKISFLPLSVAVKCALFGNIPLLLTSWFLALRLNASVYGTIITILYVLIVYNALGYSYCHIFNMGETARRIRILYELNLAGRFRYDKLADKYGVKNMIDVRLERLIDMRQISKHKGNFVLESLLLYRIGMVVLNWGFFLKYNAHLRQSSKK